MNSNTPVGNGREVCLPIRKFIEILLSKGFLMLNNGDHVNKDPKLDFLPDPKSLYFRLLGPVDFSPVDVDKDGYELAILGDNMYMCECHYHLVIIVSEP